MKKTLTILLLFTTVILQAQSFEGGLILGGAFCQIDGDASAGYNKFGVQGGAFVFIDLRSDIDAIIEIKYIQKGASNVWNGKDNTYGHYVAKLNYIEMPVMANYKFSKKLFASGGLTFGYLISAFEDEDGYGFSPAVPDFDKYEIGSIARISYELTPKLVADLSATYSVFAIRSNPGAKTTFFYRGQYNNTVQVSVRYKFFE